MHRGIALNDLTKKAKRLLEGKCWHEIDHRLDRDGDHIDEEDFGFAHCKHCDEFRFEMRWYCPSSPDHLCHYHSEWSIAKEKFFVETVNEEKVYLENYTEEKHKYETSDHCIFCGQPEERK
jgi:hypothetical protein